jgi:hypothetical protein
MFFEIQTIQSKTEIFGREKRKLNISNASKSQQNQENIEDIHHIFVSKKIRNLKKQDIFSNNHWKK